MGGRALQSETLLVAFYARAELGSWANSRGGAGLGTMRNQDVEFLRREEAGVAAGQRSDLAAVASSTCPASTSDDVVMCQRLADDTVQFPS